MCKIMEMLLVSHCYLMQWAINNNKLTCVNPYNLIGFSVNYIQVWPYEEIIAAGQSNSPENYEALAYEICLNIFPF